MYRRVVIIVFWLVLGLTLLGMSWLSPEMFQGQRQLAVRPLGWLAIVYAVYHTVRLGVDYFLRRNRSEPAVTLRRHRRPAPPAPSEPDPNLIFTDPPPEEKDPRS